MPGFVRSDDYLLKRRKQPTVHGDQLNETTQHRAGNGYSAGASRLYAPFRAVGLVSPTPIPFAATAIGKTTFQITTSIGRSLQTYDLKKGLSLVFITTPQTPGIITASASWSVYASAAWSSGHIRGVWLFRRGKKVGELNMPTNLDEDLVQLLPFGKWFIGCGVTRIEVWNSETFDHHTSIHPDSVTLSSIGSVLTGGLCTLPTYVNKIFAGREDGTVEIWNVSTAKLLYRVLPAAADSGPVTALEATPSLNILAIAYANGLVVIHDIMLDTTLISIRAGNVHRSFITSISFRSDDLGAGNDGRTSGVMATASFSSGDVSFWDLNGGGRRTGTLHSAHDEPSSSGASDGGITRVEFLSNQAILVSSGADNALKTWIFDAAPFSPVPRLLHSRNGHSRPITVLDFLPSDADGTESIGKWILSAAEDNALRSWSLRRDEQSSEISQGAIHKNAKKVVGSGASSLYSNVVQSLKASEIICIACSLNRDGGMGALPGNRNLWVTAKQLKGQSTAVEQSITGWESIVTGHKGDSRARTWFWGRKRAGRWMLETSDRSPVTSCAISPCGTFAVIGSEKGTIDTYNLQSGLHRQHYPARPTPANARRLELAKVLMESANTRSSVQESFKHEAAVTGLFVDNLNRRLVSGGLDGKIKFWDFLRGTFEAEINWGPAVSVKSIVCNRSSSLIAVSCGDHHIRLIDVEARRLVRKLTKCGKDINDLCFSNDGRWIIAACTDATIRTWDIPTGHLIDIFRLHTPCVALSFSDTGEFLATAQGGNVGIDLWSNRALFGRVAIRPVKDTELTDIQGPTASGEGGHNFLAAALEDSDNVHDDDPELDADVSVQQLSKGMMTLSTVPRARWQTLLYLDQIRERNKPKEPPKAPKSAPFFLQSVYSGNASNEPTSSVGKAIDGTEHVSQSRIVNFAKAVTTKGSFSSLLYEYRRCSDLSPILDALKAQPPAAADIAIRALNTAPPYHELITFLAALTQRLHEHRDFELIQTWIAVFLRCHGEVIKEDAMLIQSLREWREAHRFESQRLNRLVGYCAGIIGFLRDPAP